MDFYRTYPQIVGTLSPQFRRMFPTQLPKETVGTLSPHPRKARSLHAAVKDSIEIVGGPLAEPAEGDD
jgi:hypothetical protein